MTNKLPFCILLSVLSSAHAVTSPYDNTAFVTNTIAWPYNAKTYGTDTFQLGGNDNADTMILNEIKKDGLTFPRDFSFGVACSAYQYEGHRKPPSADNPDGVGWSMWDVFSEKGSWLNPEGKNIANVHPTSQYTVPNGSVAIDGFNEAYYKADIQKIKALGVQTYRLSISWPRLFPHAGMEEPDQDGVDYYIAVLEEVKKAGLTPLITLYHWDLPAWLYNFGDKRIKKKDKTYGWLDMSDARNNLTLLEYQKYVAAAYRSFGKYTPHFSSFNEPLTFTNVAFVDNKQAPGQYGFSDLQKLNPELYGNDHNESVERVPYLQAINIIKAHNIAYRTMHAIYDKNPGDYPKPQVSIVLNVDWAEPFRIEGCEDGKCRYNHDDIEASKRNMDFQFGWWLHPVMFGSWPDSMNESVYKYRIRTKKQPDLGEFGDSSCLQKDGKPVKCDKKNNERLTDIIRAGGTLDELGINHYTGYFAVDMNYAKDHFSNDAGLNRVPPNQYGGDPNHVARGWNSDQNAFITQFRYAKYGDHGAMPAADHTFVIGNAGAQSWLRQTWFVYRKLMQYINHFYLHAEPARTTKGGVPFSELGIYLTENGTSIFEESQKESRRDPNRIQYLLGNLGALQQAKNQDKVNIKLYTYWSIADNFEWGEGYDSRFGLLWIDYKTLAREPKQSYKCYQSVIRNNGSNLFMKDCPLE